MSLDNNSANNFQDFLDAIKPYLNYQLYDMSGMGVEAFQFSTDEKPVGMWTDRKIVYQKTYDIGSTITVSNSGTNITSYISNLSSIVRLVNAKGYNDNYNGAINIGVYIDSGNVYAAANGNYPMSMFTLQYTKTTDSPLASGEKFAGLTSSGEVIYKKQLSVSNISITADTDISVAHGISGIGQLCKCDIYGKIFDTTNYPSGVVLQQKKSTYCDASNLHFKTDSTWAANANTIWYLNVYYTKTS